MDDRGNWMVGGKRVKFGVKIDVGGVNPNPCAGRVPYLNIRMNLCNGDCERGSSVNDSVFTEEDDLAGSRCFHER